MTPNFLPMILETGHGNETTKVLKLVLDSEKILIIQLLKKYTYVGVFGVMPWNSPKNQSPQ